MRVNSNFLLRASMTPSQYYWVSTPQSGVERVMLDRVGSEVGRATSLVKYAEGAHFPRHFHPGGEEILVLAGTFNDGATDYTAGWYLRNPPGSSHQPYSFNGALIFVKLWQMSPSDNVVVRIDSSADSNWISQGAKQICPLYHGPSEVVWIQKVQPHGRLELTTCDGAEVLVIAGSLNVDGLCYPTGSWLRFPIQDVPKISANDSGARVYVKTGHLATDFYIGEYLHA